MAFQIVGTGRAVPEYILTNEEVSKLVDTTDEWIKTRTGINSRFVSTHETITDLAAAAGKKALEKAGLDATDLDLIICSTVMAEHASPSLSCLVQKELGAKCPAFDINAACSGFVYGLDIADAYISMGKANTVLMVGAEVMTRHVDWTDRASCVLFGDGAGAVVLQKGDGLKAIHLTAKGDDKLLSIGNTFCKSPFGRQPVLDPHFKMNGGEVFKFAVGAGLKDVKTVMSKAGITSDDIKMVIPHQANLRIFQVIKDKLGLSEDQVASGIDHYGNTSSASIPLMLDELIEQGRLVPGDIIVMTAFGGGLTSGACVIKL
ncbi:MAG: ketoacyl-ACP synthase III [Eubacteriales bacterium]|nr:ketoacyl-ACP synthase III [Eubacteriales bacterium]MDD3349323.1 ketoacyl-ACP synthase III [Eubacteriales bacterium]